MNINSTANESFMEEVLNNNPIGNNQVRMGSFLTQGVVRVIKATYSFAVLGGAVGLVNLKTDAGVNAVLPSGAVVTGGFIKTRTTLTSGGSATVAIGLVSTTDVKAATAFGTYSSTGTGIIATVPVQTAATMIVATSDLPITATIATAAVTAGIFDVYLTYVMP
jgi:hypothetical protein